MGLATRLKSEEGFTLVELSMCAVLMATALLSLVGVFDSARALQTMSESRSVATHEAQREIERVRALGYDRIGLTSAPAHSTDTSSPDYHVQGGAQPSYRWNQSSPNSPTEPLVVDTAAALDPTPDSWSAGGLHGKLYRYVTWVDDQRCGSSPLTLCPGTQDYKRLTVVATIDGQGATHKPALVSSIVADPDAAPEGAVLNGNQNPLADPSTKCLDASGTLSDCVGSLGAGDALSWFLTDTPASSNVRQAISGDHATHPTIAPIGLCTIVTIIGCPKPDLLADDPPPLVNGLLPSLFKYSTDVTGGYTGGRVLRRDTTCAGTPSTSDNTKGMFFTTPTLSSPMKLTGKGALSLATQTVDGVDASVTLCARIYDVPGSILNLISTPPTSLGTATYTRAHWPTTADTAPFPFDFRGSNGTVTVPTGHRVGIRIWASSASGADIAAIYDHPSFASSVQLNTSGS
jgi:hypothetical protein